MLAAKKSELLNYLRLAQTSIRHIYEGATPDDLVAKRRVKEVLNALTYGPDGYFFVYDYEGNNLVHPKQPHRVGNNWLDLKDPFGNFVIQNLIKRAKEGGGYHRYYWEKTFDQGNCRQNQLCGRSGKMGLDAGHRSLYR